MKLNTRSVPSEFMFTHFYFGIDHKTDAVTHHYPAHLLRKQKKLKWNVDFQHQGKN